MQRRRFLAAVGASIALAGCGSQDSASGDDPGTDTPSNADPTDTSAGSPAETPDPTDTDPPDGFALGETSGDHNPHGLTVRNDGEDARTVDLRVTDADTDETLLDRSYSLAAGGGISGELRGPATYDVRVAIPETEHETTVAYFDTCNTYGTTVTIDAGGSITSEMIRTLVACDPGGTPPDGFALGESSGDVNPHGLTVYNGGDTTRTVELRVTDADAGETRLDRSFALDADDEVSGVLRGPATYEVFVGVPEAGTDETVTVAHFDTCNDYGTKVTVGAGGSVSVEQFGTDAYCGDE